MSFTDSGALLALAIFTASPVAMLANPAPTAQNTDAWPLGVFQLVDGGKLYFFPMVDESGPTLQFATSSGLEGRAQKLQDGSFSDREKGCVNRFIFSSSGDEVDWADCHGSRHGRIESKVSGEALTFLASDGQTIGASIWRNPQKRGGPGIVLAHGANDETRFMGTIVPLLVETGLVVLTFDQRGCGLSGGAWRTDGILQIADDVAKAANLLKVEPDVDRVGFYGFSNGGWVAPCAAVKYGGPAFIIIKSGDSQSIVDNVLFETYTGIKTGFGEPAAIHARQTMETVLRALQSDAAEDWERAREALIAVRGQPWLTKTQLPPPEAIPLPPPVKAGFHRQLIYDPKVDLLKLRCPILIMLGDADVDVEGPKSAELYKAYFKQSGNDQVKIKLFKGAGHQLAQGPGPAANNAMETGNYAPGFPTVMIEWLQSFAEDSSR